MTAKDLHGDVMGALLSEEVGDDLPEVQQLNALIRSGDVEVQTATYADDEDQNWNLDNDLLSVRVWRAEGKVRIKILSKSRSKASIQRLSEVALQAIMEELKKDIP